jgi:NHL repeat-containing protein
VSRLTWLRTGWAVAAALASALVAAPGAADAQVQVAPGLRVEVMATGLPRPMHLEFDAAGWLVVVSNGWRGDAAAEIYRLDLRGAPLDASRAPRVVLPFAEGPRKVAFGSLAVDPRSGDLFLGEENGNRIYRYTSPGRLALFGMGLNHLVGGSALAFDAKGLLAVLDYASPEAQLRSEAPPPPGLDALAGDAYHGPLILRLDPDDDVPIPRRLDLVAPVFPRRPAPRPGVEPLFRLVSVAAAPAGHLVVLSSIGEVLTLGSDGWLRRLARLPSGHYHRTHLAVGPDGSIYVNSGFHIRVLYRVSPDGRVSTIARDLADPAGIAVDRAGDVYVSEGVHHRVIRIGP